METQILEILGLSLEELGTKARTEKISIKRHLFCAAMRYQNIKLKDIAARINRKHNTVSNSINKAKNLAFAEDKLIMSDYLRLQECNLIEKRKSQIHNVQ